MKVFAVYDCKAEAYLQPFFSRNAGTAVRDFASAANAEEHQFHRFAGDYTLFEIGEFDEQSGRLSASDVNINLGTALQFIKESEGGE